MHPSHSSYAVGWGTLTLINTGLAQAKNQSGLLWRPLPLILGPLVTLILMTVYARPRAPI